MLPGHMGDAAVSTGLGGFPEESADARQHPTAAAHHHHHDDKGANSGGTASVYKVKGWTYV
jgi:hypothetical protein